jgi:hypothetical protein
MTSILYIIINRVTCCQVKTIADGMRVLVSDKWISVGWKQQGRYIKSKLQNTASFIVVESLDVPHNTSCPLPSFSQKDRVYNFFLSFPIHLLRQKEFLCWSSYTHSVTWPRIPATKVAKPTAQGMNSQSEQNECWITYAKLHKAFTTVLKKPLISQGSLFPGVKTLNERLQVLWYWVFNIYSVASNTLI